MTNCRRNPYVIFEGSMRYGKTLYLRQKIDFLRKQGLKVFVVGDEKNG